MLSAKRVLWKSSSTEDNDELGRPLLGLCIGHHGLSST